VLVGVVMKKTGDSQHGDDGSVMGMASKEPDDMAVILWINSGFRPRATYLGTMVSRMIPRPPDADPVMAAMVAVAAEREMIGCMEGSGARRKPL